MTYDEMLAFLSENKYSFFACYDLVADRKEICVETEDETQILCVTFGFGFTKEMRSVVYNAKEMRYCCGNYHDLLKTMQRSMIMNGKYSYIKVNKGNKATIRF